MILFVLPEFTSIGIINSQHFAFAEKLLETRTVHIAIHNEFKLKLREPSGFKIIWYSSYQELFPILKSYKWVYVRSVYSFIPLYIKKVLSLGHFKIFYDFRALVYTEVDYVQKNRLKKALFWGAEFLSYHLASSRGAVSQKLRSKLHRSFGSKPVFMMPCCINNVKPVAEIKDIKQTTKSPILRFVYVGSMSKWQCFPQVLQIFEKISKSVSAELTVITKEEDKAREQIQNQEVKILSLSHDEVINILPKFDFGFLIREDKPINNLASPIKFLEYTSNGVIPIMSENIGDYSDMIMVNRLGVVLNSAGDIDINHIVSIKKKENIIDQLLDLSKAFVFDQYVINHPLNN